MENPRARVVSHEAESDPVVGLAAINDIAHYWVLVVVGTRSRASHDMESMLCTSFSSVLTEVVNV